MLPEIMALVVAAVVAGVVVAAAALNRDFRIAISASRRITTKGSAN